MLGNPAELQQIESEAMKHRLSHILKNLNDQHNELDTEENQRLSKLSRLSVTHVDLMKDHEREKAVKAKAIRDLDTVKRDFQGFHKKEEDIKTNLQEYEHHLRNQLKITKAKLKDAQVENQQLTELGEDQDLSPRKYETPETRTLLKDNAHMREQAAVLMDDIMRNRTYVPDHSAYKSNSRLVEQYRETLSNFELLLLKAEEERHVGEIGAPDHDATLGQWEHKGHLSSVRERQQDSARPCASAGKCPGTQSSRTPRPLAWAASISARNSSGVPWRMVGA